MRDAGVPVVSSRRGGEGCADTAPVLGGIPAASPDCSAACSSVSCFVVAAPYDLVIASLKRCPVELRRHQGVGEAMRLPTNGHDFSSSDQAFRPPSAVYPYWSMKPLGNHSVREAHSSALYGRVRGGFRQQEKG